VANKKVIVDGSYGEGGGQILRTSISLSAVLGMPVKINNIRIKRRNPGLRPQHLTGIIAASKLTNAKLRGNRIGSTSVEFIPDRIRSGDYEFDTGTAGSVTLVMQVLLPIMLSSPDRIKITVKGGTHVMHSPSYDYFKEVLLPAVRDMGACVKTEIYRYGFYPRGGGQITVECNHSELVGYEYDEHHKSDKKWPDKIVKARIIQSNKLPKHIIEREVNKINGLLNGVYLNTNIETKIVNTLSPGNAITLWYNGNGYRGSYVLGQTRKPAEKVADEAVTELLKHINYTVDEYLTDQLMIFSVMARGSTKIYTSDVSLHARTNAYIINSFLPNTIKIVDKNHVEIKGRG